MTFFGLSMAGGQKSLLSYFSPTTVPLSCTIHSRAIPGPPKGKEMQSRLT